MSQSQGTNDLEYEAEQADVDWFHSPEWSAQQAENDRLEMEYQHAEALEENEARELEAGS
jgi:hypothetical protein